MDIEPNEEAGILKRFADQHSFGWRFAVSPRDFSLAVRQAYGDQFLNPPSEPMMIIDRRGAAHLLPFEHRSAGRIRQLLAQYNS
ncbi:MAG: hypothetical protein ACR2MY_11320 [Candidatus Dormibacteria bacterium]